MRERFRKIGFVLAALVISVAIYLTFYAEEEVKQNVLEYSLDLMGEKLLALVPDGTEKNKLNELYQSFKERATKGNVAPQQIESMAANILYGNVDFFIQLKHCFYPFTNKMQSFRLWGSCELRRPVGPEFYIRQFGDGCRRQHCRTQNPLSLLRCKCSFRVAGVKNVCSHTLNLLRGNIAFCCSFLKTLI